MSNYDDWITYVNQKLDEHSEWIVKREADLAMENIRLRRLLDATLQRLGESESLLLPESDDDTPDTVKRMGGHSVYSSSAKTSEYKN